MSECTNDPDDKSGQDGRPWPMFDEVSRQIRAWSKTIDRWSTAAQPCILISRHGLRLAFPKDGTIVAEQLRERGPSTSD